MAQQLYRKGGAIIRYAGIGSRQTPDSILSVMSRVAKAMAHNGHILQTGAAKGADQAFTEGALRGQGKVELYLPWDYYERGWINSLAGNVDVICNVDQDYGAKDSVLKYHPAPGRLSRGVFNLHARNFQILRNTDLVICWSKGSGGTEQGLRIARDMGIKIYNLYHKDVLDTFLGRLSVLGI